MRLALQPGRFAIVRLMPEARIPEWAVQEHRRSFVSVTRTEDELSVVCDENEVPTDLECSTDWACLKVSGPLDLAAVGILASLAGCLRDRGVSIFAISTFDTDYILVPAPDLDEAVDALEQAGHRVTGRSGNRRPRSPRPRSLPSKSLRPRGESLGG